MRYLAAVVLALLMLMSPATASAQRAKHDNRRIDDLPSVPGPAGIDPSVSLPVENFEVTLSKAVMGVYHGKQECKWVKENFLWFDFWNWHCEFEEHFTCTATVVYADPEEGQYVALTAGHCFDWKEINNYYISDGVGDKPVMHKATVQKFANDERYDYALVRFESIRSHPAIAIEKIDAEGPAIGTQVININFSYGVVKQVMHGEVNSEIIKSTEGGDCESCRGRYLVSIGLGPGASGSAVVDAKTHEIIGFAEGIFPGTTMPTVVIPAGRRLADFLDDDSTGIKPLPEGPKPSDAPGTPQQERKTFLKRVLAFFLRFFFL
jgi:hypothetical protein